MEPVEVTVYIKEDCHLCDQMLAQLSEINKDQNGAPRFRLTLRDIEDRADWYEHYREYVPVIVVNNQEVCHYFLDQDEFEQALSCP
ncbi:MAG: glutaredoxin family protein [bacterium]